LSLFQWYSGRPGLRTLDWLNCAHSRYYQGIMQDLKAAVIARARACGFDLVGITGPDDFAADRAAALERIREGRMDGLPWYTESRVMRGTSPAELLPGARSVICLGLSYLGNDEPDEPSPSTSSGQTGVGRVARYAWVRDYHRAMKRRMRDFVRELEQDMGSTVGARWYVDDGPMLDRAAAARAGLGWFGKNTNILTSGLGSWVFLGQVVTDLEIQPDSPLKKTCGSCVRCIEACPTGALIAPYVLDNTRCISYLTIENRGEIPGNLRPLMGDWVFGCDICQDVCPVNRKAAPSSTELWERDPGQTEARGTRRHDSAGIPLMPQNSPAGNIETLDLIELLEMSEEDFADRFRGSPIRRAKRAGLQRNACVALGNRGDPTAIPALQKALAAEEALVRGHAAWALGQIGASTAYTALKSAKLKEDDGWVLQEITAALDHLRSREPDRAA
jgi:epoxyqueuosine reductase